jgi:hypothetical protein
MAEDVYFENAKFKLSFKKIIKIFYLEEIWNFFKSYVFLIKTYFNKFKE